MERALGRLEADRDGLIVWQNHAHRRVIGDAGGSHFSDFVVRTHRPRFGPGTFASRRGSVTY